MLLGVLFFFLISVASSARPVAKLGELMELDLTKPEEMDYMRDFWQATRPSVHKLIFLHAGLPEQEKEKVKVFLKGLMLRFPQVQFHWALTNEKENNRLLVSMGVPAGRVPALVLHNSELKQTRHMLENAESILATVDAGDYKPFVNFIEQCLKNEWPVITQRHKNEARASREDL